MRLLKWYGDCVTKDGQASVVYWAELEWHDLHIRYASRLETRFGERSTLRAGPPPSEDASGYRWQEPLIGLDACWKPTAPPYKATLFEGIRWCCVAPAAEARIGSRTGLGYLEYIEMTVPPWSIPIQTLLWGRFLSKDESLVWIDWRGEHQFQLVLDHGRPVGAKEIERDRLTLASGETLACFPGITLREGTLGPKVLSVIPGLPRRILNVHEHKWLSQAVLLRGEGQHYSTGWAIHEVVTWP